ncbi:MAG TPA: hypothetical protein DEB46_10970 [Myxococcales bacterium]|nr:hypothetical protein [Myxococcales bacterium]MBF94809.1 hypothetical protein [Myxococcales bacterium]HBU48822.1 hypothetical protein [Myxococcales bacterium]
MHGCIKGIIPAIALLVLSLPAAAGGIRLASVDLSELLRRESERAAEQMIWNTFKRGRLADARRHYKKGRYRKSSLLLAQELVKNEDNPPVRFLYASALEKLKRYQDCASEFERVTVEFDALHDVSTVGQARCLIGADRISEATDLLERIPSDSGKAAEARSLLAWTRYRHGEPKAVLANFRQRAELDDLPLPMEQYVYALLLRDAGEVAGAAHILRTFFRREPLSPYAGPALMDLASLKDGQRYLYTLAERKVVWSFRKRLTKFHQHGPDRTLGYVYDALRRRARGRLLAEVALARAEASMRRKLWESAVTRYRQAIRAAREPLSKAHALYGLGSVQYRRLSFSAARKAFRRVVELAPNQPIMEQALFALADMDARLGRSERAKRQLNEIMLRSPLTKNRARILWSLGWIDYRIGDFASASRLFESLLAERVRGTLGEGRDRILYWAGQTAIKQGKMERALTRFRELQRDHPISYYASALDDYLAISGITLAPLKDDGPLRKPGGLATTLDQIDGLWNSGFKSAARKRVRTLFQEIVPMLAGHDRERSFAGGLWLAALNEPSSHDLERLCAYLDRLKMPGHAHRLRGLQAAGQLAPLTSEQRSKWLKRAHPRPFWYGVSRWGGRYRVDPMLMYGLIRQESHFNPYAVSSADAIGLAQLLPSTAKQVARWIGIKAPTRTSLLEPNLNIRLGTRYLASLLKSFRGSMVLSIASYNAGPDRIRRWMRRHGDRPLDEFVEEIPFDETRLYVKRVLAGYRGYLSTYRRATKSKVSKR